MQLRIFTEPQQGATYDELLAVAQRAERLGFDAFFRSDHFLKMGDVSGEPGPSDAWITLAGLARETSRIRLGTLVTSATFRHPGPLAVAVANVDRMSGGRVELGLGAGWFQTEHDALGIPFPDVHERFDRFEEQLQIITGMWGTALGASFEHAGRHYRLTGGPGLPKPAQAMLPIIIGGHGTTRTPALAARFATEFNLAFSPLGDFDAQIARVRAACETIGRDPATIVLSAAQVLCVGRDEAEIARRAAALGRQVDELRANGVAGTPDEAVTKLREWGEHGASRVYLQVLDLTDLDHLDLVAETVAPHLG